MLQSNTNIYRLSKRRNMEKEKHFFYLGKHNRGHKLECYNHYSIHSRLYANSQLSQRLNFNTHLQFLIWNSKERLQSSQSFYILLIKSRRCLRITKQLCLKLLKIRQKSVSILNRKLTLLHFMQMTLQNFLEKMVDQHRNNG